MTSLRISSIALAGILIAAGCGKSRSTPPADGGPVTMPGVAGDGSDDVTVESRWCVKCHGDASRSPVATDAAGIAFAPPRDVSGAATGAKVGAHMAHLRASPLRATGVNCSACHVVPATADVHVPGVSLRGLAAFRLGSTPAYTPTYTSGTCANTYCHGNFNGGLSADPAWTGGAVACGSCHALPPALKSDGTAHSSSTGCGTCHPGYTNTTVAAATHIDGTIDVVGGCAACHGTSGRPDGDMAGATYDGNQEAAPPVDTDGNDLISDVRVGVHQAHVNPTTATGVYKPILCTECHPDNTSGVGHPGGGLTVTFAAATGADLAGYVPGFVQGNGTSTATTCTTYCHGSSFPNGNGSVGTWSWTGAAAACDSCHGAPPAFLPNGTTPHPNNTACEGCHSGYTNASVNLATHIDGTVQGTGTCTSCHGEDGRANGDMALPYDANQPAAPPLDSNGAGTGVLVGVHLAHVNPSNGTGVYKPIACTECHPDNTSGGHPGGGLTVTFTAATGADLASYVPGFVQGNGTSTSTTCTTYCHDGGALGAGYAGSVATWAWDGAAASCGSCHAAPPSTGGHAGVNPGDNCGGCHPGYGATSVNLATHINGQLDGGESAGGLSCGACHKVIFEAMNGTTPKTSFHQLGAVAGTNDSATDSGLNWTSPLDTNQAPAVRSCVNMCHQDHPHTLGGTSTTHEYNVYADNSARATAPTTSTRARTDFDAAATNGGLCVSCHLNPVTAGAPTIAKAAYDASAHDFTSASGSSWEFRLHTTTGTANAFLRNCTKCHASNVEGTTPTMAVTSSSANSVHYNVNPTLLAGSTTLTPGVSDLVCYNCHGSTATPANGAQGNRSGKNIQGQFSKASTHAVAGVTCMSCHEPHRTKAGTHATPGNLAGEPLEGASGAELTGSVAFWAAPVAGNFTGTTIVAEGGATPDLEATLCFKCHSAFAGTLPAGTTDVAREFNPANVGNFAGTWASGETAGGFHPVLADAGASLGRVNMANLVTTNFAWRTTGARNLMTCTDCHESNNTADPNGPHGSSANFLLKGPNTAWSASIILGSTIPAGTFCLNCHQNTFANSRFPDHDRGDHSVACFKCHAAIPHGGPRPGMLNAGAGAAAAVGGSIAGWDGVAPYWQGGTGDRLYLKTYPANGTADWSQSNCGCNGTGH